MIQRDNQIGKIASCHPEQSEGSPALVHDLPEILRFAQDDISTVPFLVVKNHNHSGRLYDNLVTSHALSYPLNNLRLLALPYV